MTTRTRDYLPTNDASLLGWAKNLLKYMQQAGPSLGITTQQAAAYAPLVEAFEDVLQRLQDPVLASESAKEQKKEAKVMLTRQSRVLVRLIQAFPTLTDTQRRDLRITIPDRIRTRVPVPTNEPTVKVLSVVGRRVMFNVDAAGGLRGKPKGALEVRVMTFVGAEPPAMIELFEFRLSSGRTKRLSVMFNHTVPDGAQVWIVACWANRSGVGPLGAATTTRLPGGQAVSGDRSAA